MQDANKDQDQTNNPSNLSSQAEDAPLHAQELQSEPEEITDEELGQVNGGLVSNPFGYNAGTTSVKISPDSLIYHKDLTNPWDLKGI